MTTQQESVKVPVQRYYRKIIKIRAVDSPNVRFALWQQSQGLTPTNEVVVPGVLTWNDYLKRRTTWPPNKQRISLDAEFPDGEGIMLYPMEWLIRAETLADYYERIKMPRQARAIGIDPAEGGDDTVMCAVDEYGLLEMEAVKTPNTAVITSKAIAFGTRLKVPPAKWVFDRGGGGKQHADRLREQGYPVQTVSFGESISQPIKAGGGRVTTREKIEQKEAKYTYFNRRAEMYGALNLLLDPYYERGFALPTRYQELHRQLSLIPEMLDAEGRLKLPPKHKKSPNSTEQTMVDLIGCSPDEADSLVLAVWGLTHEIRNAVAGAMWDLNSLPSKGDDDGDTNTIGGMWNPDDFI